MTALNYYLDEFTDEVIPCAPTLEAWAEWLSKPDPNWSDRLAATADGATFKVSTLEVLGDIRVEHNGEAWAAVTPIPAGTEAFFLRHFEGSPGWDAEFSSNTIADATDCLLPGDGPLFFACVKDGPNYIATFRAEGPRLELEPPAMTAPFDVSAVLIGLLLHERQYWREIAAANISTLIAGLGLSPPRLHCAGPKVPKGVILAALREWTGALDGALSGELGHTRCEICGHAVWPGQLVVDYSDVGEAHATCAGVPADQLHHGGEVELGPDEIPEPQPGEPPHPGYMSVYRSEALYTDAGIAARLARGLQTLGGGVAQ